MARYNAWQNRQIARVVEVADPECLTKDRGAFFGSIHRTLNHVLWADKLWMNRFDPSVNPPEVPAEQHTELTPTITVWGAERFHLDGKIRLWADGLNNVDLHSELTFYSKTAGRELTQRMDAIVMHFFNHQTHHRGQVHAMMTAAGLDAPVSDLLFMPEDF